VINLLLTDILSRIYCFEVITDYCSNCGNFAFLSLPLGELIGTTYTVHLRLVGKLVEDFLCLLKHLLTYLLLFVLQLRRYAMSKY